MARSSHAKTLAGAALVAFLVYCLGSLALFFQPGLLTGTHQLGYGTDPYLYIWAFEFIPRAIAHWQNPFVIPLAWAPAGLNITQAATTAALALLFWPVTALAGPVVSFNIASLLAPALSAAAMFLFAYELSRKRLASFIAGWLFGFSTYEIGALLGHLHVSFVPLVPLAFLAVVLHDRGRLSAAGFVLLLSAMNIVQFLICLEIFVTTAIFLAIFIAAQAARERPGLRASAKTFGLFALSYAITAVVVSPYIYYFFHNYAQIPHVLENGGYFSIDLLNFVVPTVITWLGGMWLAPIAHFARDVSEDVGYIGLPLAILTLVAIAGTWRDRRAAPVIVTLLVAALFALGPSLRVGGLTIMPLPWALMEKLPLLQNVATGRLMMFAAFGIGAVCALWLGRLRRFYYLGCAVVAAAALLTLPRSVARQVSWWYDPLPSAQLFQTAAYRHDIAPGQNVMFLPFQGANGDSILWQTLTHGYFRTIDGYGNFIPPPFSAWPAAKMLESGAPGPGFASQFNLFMKHFGVRLALVPQAYQAAWDKPLAAAGWQRRAVGNYALYTLPDEAWSQIPDGTATDARLAFDDSHLNVLRQAAICVLAGGKTRIDPNAAVADGCLDPAFGSAPGSGPTNWDKLNGWLGEIGGGIGVSVVTDGRTARRLAAQGGRGVSAIYFPYPERFDPAKVTPDQTGQFFRVYNRSALAAKTLSNRF